MTKHTPGPWLREDTVILYRPDHAPRAGARFVCRIQKGPFEPEEWQANARLITGEPDLLAALEAMLEDGEYDDNGDFVLAHSSWDGECNPPDTSEPPSVKQADAAIAKAKRHI